MRITRWTVAVLAAGAVTLAGAGAVAAAGGTPGGPGAFLADVAGHLGVQPSALQNAIGQADIDRVHQLESAGKITAVQAQNRISRIQAGRVAWLGPRAKVPLRLLSRRVVVSAATAYLGVSGHQVTGDLKAGQSLNEIAASVSGKSAAGLQAAIAGAVQARLAVLLSNNRLTATREQNLLKAVQNRLPQLMARTWNRRAVPQDASPQTPGANTGAAVGA